MTPNLALTLSQVGATVFSMLAILCGFGIYYFGNQVDEERDNATREFQTQKFEIAENDRQVKHDAISTKIDEAVLELKNFIVKGDPSLVNKIPENADWDLLEGSVYLLVTIPASNANSLMLRIESKTNDAYLEFIISTNAVRFIYSNPGLGELSKNAEIFDSDFKNNNRGLVVSFIWNLKEYKTNIYINEHERA